MVLDVECHKGKNNVTLKTHEVLVKVSYLLHPVLNEIGKTK